MDIVIKIDESLTALPRTLVGNTQRFNWISSGNISSASNLAVYNGDETLVNSVTPVNSQNGLYYADIAVSTPGFYSAQWSMTIGGNVYKRGISFQATLIEVD